MDRKIDRQIHSRRRRALSAGKKESQDVALGCDGVVQAGVIVELYSGVKVVVVVEFEWGIGGLVDWWIGGLGIGMMRGH